MDIKVLRNYVEIVDSGNITAAAKKLFIAQPALSNQLKKLEKELGTTLIDRGPHHQNVTHSGKLFYERAKHIIELEDGTKRDILKYENRQLGTIRLGITPFTSATLFDGIIVDFCKKHPGIRHEFYEYDSGMLIELIENRVIDVAIVRTPCRIPKNADTFYLEQDKWLAIYADGFFESENDEISFDELKDLPITLIHRHEDIIDKACDDINYMPNIKYVAVQLSTVFNLAKSSLAVGIVPSTSIDYIEKSGLKYKKIKNEVSPISRAIVCLNDRELPVICRDFVDFCRESLKM